MKGEKASIYRERLGGEWLRLVDLECNPRVKKSSYNVLEAENCSQTELRMHKDANYSNTRRQKRKGRGDHSVTLG